MDESWGIKIVYDKKISAHLAGKLIDYHDGAQGGFTITAEAGGNGCSGCGG